MRRAGLATVFLLAASAQALAAGTFVTRNVQDGSGFHTQTFFDESGVGTGPFDPVVVSGLGGAPAAPNTGLTFTTTDLSISAAGVATFNADASIKYLRVTNKGTGLTLYTLSVTDAASATHGVPLGPAPSSPGQGGTDFYETTAVPTKGLSFYAVAATTVAIVAGR